MFPLNTKPNVPLFAILHSWAFSSKSGISTNHWRTCSSSKTRDKALISRGPPPPTQRILSRILSFLHTLRFQPPFSPRIVSLIQYVGLIDLQLVNRVDPPDRIVRGQSVLRSRDGWAVESIWEQFSSNFHREEIELRTHCGSNFEQR